MIAATLRPVARAAAAPLGSVASRRALSATPMVQVKHELPPLPYAYNALEPAISEQIMTLHHTKHHQNYVNGLNTAEEGLEAALSSGDVQKQIALQSALKFNGGGHVNHSLFWKNLAPHGSPATQLKSGSPLEKAIVAEFGSVDAFKTKFNAAAAAIQGSGWAWLGKTDSGKLVIETTKDQDPLISSKPLIGVDAWEHAFYLQYQNVKADYFKAIWSVVNWEEAEKRFA